MFLRDFLRLEVMGDWWVVSGIEILESYFVVVFNEDFFSTIFLGDL